MASWFRVPRVVAKTITLLATCIETQCNELMLKLMQYPTRPLERPVPDLTFDFVQFASDPEPAVIEADVVIVGSGCGGAVAAKNLAEAGHKVVVVDKGYHFQPSQFPMSQSEGFHHLFESGGYFTTDNSSMSLIAGSCWGGGGTVNWSVSMQTQDFVRKEWAENRNLPFFTSDEYQKCLDRVCEFMGVSTEGIQHNFRNQVLLEGSRKLGLNAAAAPVNAGGREHNCGQCHLGCPSAGKRGPTVSWLAAARDAGAQFVEGLQVDKVLFDETGDKTATGIAGTWTSRDHDGGFAGSVESRVRREVVVKAKKVVISAGTSWSPLLLMNSGIEV